ncbi:Short-chain dehydrogenase/reductase SDR [Dillenia turbinata]|uniref:Short-chain dehydrogenase/reductase SDR n=1 Tax=Dillenia turbinata TaxID=194707 RepID=A0AAN8VNM9_9MAGN
MEQLIASELVALLEGKVTLITGAVSGIGRETATKFIEDGAKVVIADIQQELEQETENELELNATFIACNVTRESDISSAVDFAIYKYNKLDIIYNNAGIAYRTTPSIVDLDLYMFDRVMAVNVSNAVEGIKRASRVSFLLQTYTRIKTLAI